MQCDPSFKGPLNGLPRTAPVTALDRNAIVLLGGMWHHMMSLCGVMEHMTLVMPSTCPHSSTSHHLQYDLPYFLRPLSLPPHPNIGHCCRGQTKAEVIGSSLLGPAVLDGLEKETHSSVPHEYCHLQSSTLSREESRILACTSRLSDSIYVHSFHSNIKHKYNGCACLVLYEMSSSVHKVSSFLVLYSFCTHHHWASSSVRGKGNGNKNSPLVRFFSHSFSAQQD